MSKNYLIRPTEELLDIYINALQHYIVGRIGTKTCHVEDFAIELANFTECFYSTIQALPKDI